MPSILAFHGTNASEDFDRFEHTDDVGFHFGSVWAANRRLEQIIDHDTDMLEDARIIPCILTFERALRVVDCHTWGVHNVLSALENTGVFAQKPELLEAVRNDGFLDQDVLRRLLHEVGYDALVYDNVTETGGDSYMMLSAGQIRFALPMGAKRMKHVVLTDSGKQKASEEPIMTKNPASGAAKAPTDSDAVSLSGRLFSACRGGSVFDVVDLIDRGAEVNTIENVFSNLRPLHVAAECGHVDVIEALLDRGADIEAVDVDQKTALYVAAAVPTANALDVSASTRQLQAVRVLLERGANMEASSLYKRTALHAAVKARSTDIASLIIARGANLLAADDEGMTALHHAVVGKERWNQHEDFEALLDVFIRSGVDLNARENNKRTALHLAGKLGLLSVTQALTSRGAETEICDKEWLRPLHHAAHQGHTDVALALVAAGANMESKNRKRQTPLDQAMAQGQVETAMGLIAHGADSGVLEGFRNKNLPPLHAAARGGFTHRMLELLNAGSSPDAVHALRTPADEARREGQDETLAALQAWKARRAIDEAMGMAETNSSANSAAKSVAKRALHR